LTGKLVGFPPYPRQSLVDGSLVLLA
jgi:hypothetical protein